VHSENEWGISLELDTEAPAVVAKKTVEGTQQSLSELMQSMKSL
jgi:hypothetical protein